jgi:hypothetical protein
VAPETTVSATAVDDDTRGEETREPEEADVTGAVFELPGDLSDLAVGSEDDMIYL